MKIFLDTANLQEIRKGADMGVVDGVTTNPSLIAKEGADFHTRMKEICKIVKGPVSAEVVSTSHDEMIAEAEPLTQIASNIVIKLPCIVEGLKACKTLSDRGIRTNMTLCFQPLQAMLVLSSFAAMRTGEAEEDRVESVVAESAIETHEEAAELFTWAAAGALVLYVASAAIPVAGVARSFAVAATAVSLIVLILGYRVGHAGGELVYRHGAAAAYTAGATASAGGDVDTAEARRGDDDW